jgi:hypothetical protein
LRTLRRNLTFCTLGCEAQDPRRLRIVVSYHIIRVGLGYHFRVTHRDRWINLPGYIN